MGVLEAWDCGIEQCHSRHDTSCLMCLLGENYAEVLCCKSCGLTDFMKFCPQCERMRAEAR